MQSKKKERKRKEVVPILALMHPLVNSHNAVVL